jgi:Tol biopolymer transport system component
MNLRFFQGATAAILVLSAPPDPLAADTEAGGEARFLSNVRQLTFAGRRSGEGYFSPDGKALIFQSEREPGNPFYQIYILDLANGDSHRVSSGIGKTTCAFFRPGADEVLFASTHLDPEAKAKQKAELDFRAAGKERRYSWDYDEQMDIFAARRDGARLRRLTDAPGYDAEAAYSPDGKKIVFCSLRDAYPTNKLALEQLKRLETDPAWFGEVYIMNADGSDQRRLTRSPGYDGGPFFSPDGKRILWRHFEESGSIADIYTMKLDGSDTRRLTDFKSMSWAPYFHPSGRYVIFTSNKLGFSNFELHLVDALGQGEPVRVTFTEGFDGLPVFSPDGTQLCWTSSRTADGKSQLFLADWNHEAALAAIQATSAARDSGRQTTNRAAAREAPKPGTSVSGWPAQETIEKLRAEVSYLASDALAGRMTGSEGSRAAADFIAAHFRQAGLKPVGESKNYFQDFEFTAGVRILTNDNRLAITRRDETAQLFQVEKDFRPLSFTANGEIDGEVIFAGYGLSVPGSGGAGYDSYAGVNVTNKIVLALRYAPEDAAPKRRQDLNRYAGLRYKAMIAREHGAKGVLFVTGPNSPNAGELAGLAFDGSLSGSGIIAASISSNVVETLFAGSDKRLKSLQSDLDKENPHADSGFVLPKVTVKLAAAVEQVKKADRNVLGCLPPAGDAVEYIVLGAHYDHLGFGESGAMLRQGEENKIHPGADDNASGTATVLELAAALAKESSATTGRFRRGVIFALWSGEEIGLIGSSYFVEHPPVALTNVAAYLNFDMVGRLNENKLILQGAGSSASWRRWIEKRNVAAGFNIVLQEDPYLPTDVTAFYPKEVPVLNFFTGSHEDYHRPTDTADKLNYDGLARIGQFARGLSLDLVQSAGRPDYVRVTRRDSGGGRENLRAYLGTIPDYTTEVAGVKLSGVRGGSPAEKAGLKGGDIIVEFGGQKIANIYDYTYALDAVKIGAPVNVIVMRDGKRTSLTATPEVRK